MGFSGTWRLERSTDLRDFTPTSLVFIGFAMCVGAQLDSWLWGLTIALGLLWAMAVVPIVHDYW